MSNANQAYEHRHQLYDDCGRESARILVDGVVVSDRLVLEHEHDRLPPDHKHGVVPIGFEPGGVARAIAALKKQGWWLRGDGPQPANTMNFKSS